MLRWAHGRERGRIAPGSGVVVNQADPAINGRKGAWKNTDEYQALLRKVIPAEEDPNKRGTFAWLVTQGLNAAEGGDVKMAFTCPECEHDFTQVVWKRPDANAIIKLMEMVHGRAVEQKDINIRAEAIYRLLDEREDLKQLKVYEVDPHEKAERRELEPEDADWKEVPV